MPFTVLDLVVLGIVAVSALLAAVRGVTREVLAIVAWVAAAAVAWTLYPMLLPTVKQHVRATRWRSSPPSRRSSWVP